MAHSWYEKLLPLKCPDDDVIHVYVLFHRCWFSYNLTPYYWILEGPRLAIIVVNLMFLLNIIRVLVTKLRSSSTSDTKQARYVSSTLNFIRWQLGLFYKIFAGKQWREQLYCYHYWELPILPEWFKLRLGKCGSLLCGHTPRISCRHFKEHSSPFCTAFWTKRWDITDNDVFKCPMTQIWFCFHFPGKESNLQKGTRPTITKRSYEQKSHTFSLTGTFRSRIRSRRSLTYWQSSRYRSAVQFCERRWMRINKAIV
jgi:hypothetical protein